MTAPQTTVHVVVAIQGEYSDRMEWVCGVFTDGERARMLAEEKLRAARAALVQGREWQSKCRAQIPPFRMFPDTPEERERTASRDRAMTAFKAEHGECPHPEADDFTVVAVRLNEWGRWDAYDIAEMVDAR